jgi:hypothetical protein
MYIENVHVEVLYVSSLHAYHHHGVPFHDPTCAWRSRNLARASDQDLKSFLVPLIFAAERYEPPYDMHLIIHYGDEPCLDRLLYLWIYTQERSHVAIPVPAHQPDLLTAPLGIRYFNFPYSNHEPKIMPQFQSTTIPYRTAYLCA